MGDLDNQRDSRISAKNYAYRYFLCLYSPPVFDTAIAQSKWTFLLDNGPKQHPSPFIPITIGLDPIVGHRSPCHNAAAPRQSLKPQSRFCLYLLSSTTKLMYILETCTLLLFHKTSTYFDQKKDHCYHPPQATLLPTFNHQPCSYPPRYQPQPEYYRNGGIQVHARQS